MLMDFRNRTRVVSNSAFGGVEIDGGDGVCCCPSTYCFGGAICWWDRDGQTMAYEVVVNHKVSQ